MHFSKAAVSRDCFLQVKTLESSNRSGKEAAACSGRAGRPALSGRRRRNSRQGVCPGVAVQGPLAGLPPAAPSQDTKQEGRGAAGAWDVRPGRPRRSGRSLLSGGFISGPLGADGAEIPAEGASRPRRRYLVRPRLPAPPRPCWMRRWLGPSPRSDLQAHGPRRARGWRCPSHPRRELITPSNKGTWRGVGGREASCREDLKALIIYLQPTLNPSPFLFKFFQLTKTFSPGPVVGSTRATFPVCQKSNSCC